MKKITKWFQPQQKKDIMVDIASMIAFILADMNITAKELGEKTFFESWYLSLIKHLNYKELSDIMVHKFAMSLKLVRPYFNWSFVYNWNKDHPDDPNSHYPDIPPYAPRIADIYADSLKKYETLDAENDMDAKQKKSWVEEEEEIIKDMSNKMTNQILEGNPHPGIGLLTEDIPFSEASQESINRLAEEQSMLNKTQSLFNDLADAMNPVISEKELKSMQFNTSKHMPENKTVIAEPVKKAEYTVTNDKRTLHVNVGSNKDYANLVLDIVDNRISSINLLIKKYDVDIWFMNTVDIIGFSRDIEAIVTILSEYLQENKLT